ncbi:MAG TPA: hypothetical protein VHZ95_00570, partial [Polyangiales bacterium]|nr:hypothetical protein [Polyangiales bacterium]
DCLNIATIGQIGPWGDGNNVFQNWLDAHGATPATNLGDQEITEKLLAKFQIVVLLYASTKDVTNDGQTLHAHHAFTNREVEAFTNWVKKGNGVMTTSGYTSDEGSEVENVNKLLAPFGLGYSKTKLSLDGDITDWTAGHPLTDGVSRIHTDIGVEPDGPNGLTLARDQNMHVALQVSQGDDANGHIVVWGDEWITYDSEWEADDQVERFWLNILKWTSPSKVCQVPISPD